MAEGAAAAAGAATEERHPGRCAAPTGPAGVEPTAECADAQRTRAWRCRSRLASATPATPLDARRAREDRSAPAPRATRGRLLLSKVTTQLMVAMTALARTHNTRGAGSRCRTSSRSSSTWALARCADAAWWWQCTGLMLCSPSGVGGRRRQRPRTPPPPPPLPPQRLLAEHGEIHLSGLGLAVSTLVSVVELLKKDGLAVEKSEEALPGRVVLGAAMPGATTLVGARYRYAARRPQDQPAEVPGREQDTPGAGAQPFAVA